MKLTEYFDKCPQKVSYDKAAETLSYVISFNEALKSNIESVIDLCNTMLVTDVFKYSEYLERIHMISIQTIDKLRLHRSLDVLGCCIEQKRDFNPGIAIGWEYHLLNRSDLELIDFILDDFDNNLKEYMCDYYRLKEYSSEEGICFFKHHTLSSFKYSYEKEEFYGYTFNQNDFNFSYKQPFRVTKHTIHRTRVQKGGYLEDWCKQYLPEKYL